VGSKVKRFTYTKDSGETSNRLAIVVSKPRKNYLMYDVTDLNYDEIEYFRSMLAEIEGYRTQAELDFEKVTGKKVPTFWRSFKPEGIEWEDEI
jgi:hypothetical protein